MVFIFIMEPSPLCHFHSGLIQVLLPPPHRSQSSHSRWPPPLSLSCLSFPSSPTAGQDGTASPLLSIPGHRAGASCPQLLPLPSHPSSPSPWLVQASPQLLSSMPFPQLTSFLPQSTPAATFPSAQDTEPSLRTQVKGRKAPSRHSGCCWGANYGRASTCWCLFPRAARRGSPCPMPSHARCPRAAREVLGG